MSGRPMPKRQAVRRPRPADRCVIELGGSWTPQDVVIRVVPLLGLESGTERARVAVPGATWHGIPP